MAKSLLGLFCYSNCNHLSPDSTYGFVFVPEVTGVTFSDSDSAPVPKCLNPGSDPGLAILQI